MPNEPARPTAASRTASAGTGSGRMTMARPISATLCRMKAPYALRLTAGPDHRSRLFSRRWAAASGPTAWHGDHGG